MSARPRPSPAARATPRPIRDTVTLRLFKRAAGSSALVAVGDLHSVTIDGEDWQIAWQGTPLADGEYWVKACQKDAPETRATPTSASDEWGARRFTVGAASATTPSPTIDPITATRDRTPNLTGGASTQAGDSNVTVKIYAGASTAGTLLRTLTTPRNGTNWSLADQTWTDERRPAAGGRLHRAGEPDQPRRDAAGGHQHGAHVRGRQHGAGGESRQPRRQLVHHEPPPGHRAAPRATRAGPAPTRT